MQTMKSIAFRNTPTLLAALILAAGCGGGSGNGSSNVQGAVHQGSAGMGTFSFQGNPKPLVTVSTGSVTSTTMAGASFTSLILTPTPSLQNTDLVWSMTANGTDEIYKLNYGTSLVQTVTNTLPGYSEPTQSKYGIIYCTGPSTQQGCYQVNIDGTHLKSISTGQRNFAGPSVSPNGATLAFESAGLFTCPVGGGTATTIEVSGNGLYENGMGTSWSPTGTSICYQSDVGGGNPYIHVFTTPIAGGTPTDITPTALADQYYFWPSWSPTGTNIVAQGSLPSGYSGIIIMSATNPAAGYIDTTPAAYDDFTPAYSPDGSKIAFYRNNTGGASPGIYVEDSTGLNQSLVATLPSGVQPDKLCWSPFPAAETYVPNTSFSASALSGFILTQNGPQFGSLLGFLAKTPSSATVTTSSTSGYQPLVFTLSADAITSILYTNAYFTYGTAVTPPASTPTALVTVDANTGAIDAVATAARPLSKFTPSTRSVGSNLVYEGPFTAVYGPKGNRLDTNGASQVVIDGKTGKLVSFN